MTTFARGSRASLAYAPEYLWGNAYLKNELSYSQGKEQDL